MANRNGSGWSIVTNDQEGTYWQRRSGEVVARVRKTVLYGTPVWQYEAGLDKWKTVGYKDTIRSAKIAATKAFHWYKLREQDFKRTEAKLRLSWESQGIESVEPVKGNAWDERADRVASHGILWQWNRDSGVWESGAWKLWYNRATGWMLAHPDGYVQSIHVDNRYDAMKEAAFWISRCLA